MNAGVTVAVVGGGCGMGFGADIIVDGGDD